jgi:prolyl-tRNA synthetase
MAAVVEKFHDEKGMIWPETVTPYQVHLINLKTDGEEIYKKLTEAGVEVLWDDREEVSAGVKFADADLIGIPVRLVVSERNKDRIEWKKRNENKTELLSLEAVIKRCQTRL